MNIPTVIAWGMGGAILAEVVKQRQKWAALSERKYRAQFKSVKFWVTVLFLMACGGVAAYFLLEDAVQLSAKSCFAAGAGAQALLRSIAASATIGKAGHRFGFGRAELMGEDRLSWADILS